MTNKRFKGKLTFQLENKLLIFTYYKLDKQLLNQCWIYAETSIIRRYCKMLHSLLLDIANKPKPYTLLRETERFIGFNINLVIIPIREKLNREINK